MSSIHRRMQSDSEFERTLLESAQNDAPPDDAQQAWARFAGVMNLVVSGTEPGSGLHSANVPGDGTASSAITQVAAVRAARVGAMKWLLLGALAGSGLTVTVLMDRHPSKLLTPPRPAAAASTSTIRANSSPSSFEGASKDVNALPITSASASAFVTTNRRRSAQAWTPSNRQSDRLASATVSAPKDQADEKFGETLVAPSSTLAAEVSRLDAARTAIAAGAYDEAIRRIERYHRDFPAGALSPDADVVAIEAEAAKPDQAAVARRAAAFLSRYPGDPHAARVKWLAGH